MDKQGLVLIDEYKRNPSSFEVRYMFHSGLVSLRHPKSGLEVRINREDFEDLKHLADGMVGGSCEKDRIRRQEYERHLQDLKLQREISKQHVHNSYYGNPYAGYEGATRGRNSSISQVVSDPSHTHDINSWYKTLWTDVSTDSGEEQEEEPKKTLDLGITSEY